MGRSVHRQGPGGASSSAASRGSARLSSSKLVQAKVRFRLQQSGGGALPGNSALGALAHRGAEPRKETAAGLARAWGAPRPSRGLGAVGSARVPDVGSIASLISFDCRRVFTPALAMALLVRVRAGGVT